MGANAQTTVPTFVSGQVLTADQQNQSARTGVPVFAGTTERDAAFGGTGEKTLAEGQFCYLEDTNATQYYDGTNWINLGPRLAIFNETQASGTNGGTFTSGSYVKRTLNTTVQNDISGCSIASSVITLPAGTYYVVGRAPATVVNAHKTRLQNTTDATTIQIGASAFSNTAAGAEVTDSFVYALFTLAAQKNIELQHRCETTRNTNGLGLPTSFGDSEIYSSITIMKLA